MPTAEDLHRHSDSGKTFIYSRSKEPPQLPLYNELMVQVSQLQATAIATATATAKAAEGDTSRGGDKHQQQDSLKETLKWMLELLPKYKSLAVAIQCIEDSPSDWAPPNTPTAASPGPAPAPASAPASAPSDLAPAPTPASGPSDLAPALWEALIHDRLCCTFGVERLQPHEMPVVTAAASSQCGRSVIMLVLDDKVLEAATQTIHAMRPMRRFDVDDKFYADTVRKVLEADAADRLGDGADPPETIVSNDPVDEGLASLTVKILDAVNDKAIAFLWDRCRRLLGADSNTVETEIPMSQWVLAIRDISISLDSYGKAVEKMGPTNAVKITLFTFVRQALSNGCALTAIATALAPFLAEEYPDFGDAKLSLLASRIPALTAGWEEREASKASSSLLEFLVRWLEGGKFQEASTEDIEFLLSGMGSDATGGTEEVRKLIGSVPVLVQVRWLSQVLPQQPVGGKIEEELGRRQTAAAAVPVVPYLPGYVSKAVQLIRHRESESLGQTAGSGGGGGGGGAGGAGASRATASHQADDSLAALVFLASLKYYKQSDVGDNLDELLELSLPIATVNGLAGASQVDALRISAVALLAVDVAADQWRQRRGSQAASVESKAGKLNSLFITVDGLREYFLASLRSESAIARFLSSKDRLARFNIPESWYVEPQTEEAMGGTAAVGKDELLGRMPFMVIQTDEGFADYAAVAAIVKSEDAGAPTQLHTWVGAQVAAGKLYKARMMIFLAAFHECFMRNKSSTCVTRFLDTAANLTSLKITADEKEAYQRVCSGPAAGGNTSADDGISYLFSAMSMRENDEWMISRRNCAANAMAVILGSPPTRCYYYMVCFEERYRESFGLGSGYNLISKDCGYQVDLDTFKDIGYGALGHAPFRDIRRYRALNNYLVWAAFAWGHWLRPAQEAYFDEAVTYRERFNTEGYDAESEVARREAKYHDALTRKQRTARNMVERGKREESGYWS